MLNNEIKTAHVPPRLWRDAELAKALDVSPRAPAQWRYLGKYKDELPFVKIGRLVRYRDDVALSFIERHTMGGTGPEGIE